MALGILEPRNSTLHDIPGTCFFEDADIGCTDGDSLKRHPSRPDIILRPQPSDDPCDPLNWSTIKKNSYFAALLYATALGGVVGPLFVPSFGDMSVEFGVPLSLIAQLNGDMILGLGISSFLTVTLATVWGKRPMLLLSALTFTAGCAWASKAQSYGSLAASRWIQGLGVGAFGCLGSSCICDIFFAHEIGTRIAMWQFVFMASINLAPIISSRIIVALGWRTAFAILAACLGPAVISLFVFCPECGYQRVPTAASVDDDAAEKSSASSKVVAASHVAESPSSSLRRSRWAQYSVWGGRINDQSPIKALLTPFAVMFTPSVFYCVVTYGWCFCVTIVTNATFSQIFAAPPYNLGVGAVGNIAGIPPLIGSLLGCAIAGPLTDRSSAWLAKRNSGILEAEHRLLIMVPAGLFSLAGMLVYGFSAQRGANVIVPCVGIAIMQFGLTLSYVGTIVYSASVFPARGGDTYGIIMLTKSCMAYGLSYVVNDWLAQVGPIQFLAVMGAIVCGLCLGAIPMYVFGKRLRAFASDSKLLGWTTR